ncbi:MAG: DNA mismatch repair endonuclease MutL [Corallococcus sp.]|nr:DNA mismatch repair endonuclease MutL [Corallococcus sp.]
MADIKILQPEIYNLISAGEVIESPVGAVKELVENSIDAGATLISIDIVNGGFDCITISDNGSGMGEDDVALAFLKHATSKLTSAEDLSAIQTLGFRGEALPSIAAVSRVKLTTKRTDSDAAVSVTLENGIITSKNYVSGNVGTVIEVRDLFYNTPARKKFFRVPKREGAEISKFVSKLILTNPHLEVSFSMDGKQIYRTKGEGLNEAIFAVYGEECISNCLPVAYGRNNCRVSGYIGTPEYSKPNKLQQTISVNGRYISDIKVSSAISQAYVPYLMTRRFAFFVLDIEVPYDDVDVNVHPKKAEVHFSDYRAVCAACYNAVSKALEEYAKRRVQNVTEIIHISGEESGDELKRHAENSTKLTRAYQ